MTNVSDFKLAAIKQLFNQGEEIYETVSRNKPTPLKGEKFYVSTCSSIYTRKYSGDDINANFTGKHKTITSENDVAILTFRNVGEYDPKRERCKGEIFQYQKGKEIITLYDDKTVVYHEGKNTHRFADSGQLEEMAEAARNRLGSLQIKALLKQRSTHEVEWKI